MYSKKPSFGLTAVTAMFVVSLLMGAHAVAQRERVLHSLSNNGLALGGPYGRVIFDSAGNLYSTTVNSTSGAGLAFEMTPSADRIWTATTLFDFGTHHGSNDGAWPSSGLVFDGARNLYGTTPVAGVYDGGTVYELTPQASGRWMGKVLHNFHLAGGDGYQPVAGLIFDSSGNLYGTTALGGAYDNGTVYEITP